MILLFHREFETNNYYSFSWLCKSTDVRRFAFIVLVGRDEREMIVVQRNTRFS